MNGTVRDAHLHRPSSIYYSNKFQRETTLKEKSINFTSDLNSQQTEYFSISRFLRIELNLFTRACSRRKTMRYNTHK
jgi:transcription initiation factor TFIID subunit TAF12